MFVLDSETPQAKYILDWLIENSCRLEPHYDKINPFKVYSLNKLVYEVRRQADVNDTRYQFTSTAQVADKLTSGTFDFSANMACQVIKFSIDEKDLDRRNRYCFFIQWHEEDDNVKYCSLNRVRNYAYIISDLCCECYNLSLLSGRHVPANMADEGRYVVMPKVAKREEVTIMENILL